MNESVLTVKSKPAQFEIVDEDERLVSGFACYSADTEILTERGWIKFPELRFNDRVLVRKADGKAEFLPIKKIYVYDYRGEMIRIASKRVDLLVTPNHKIFYKNKYGAVFFEEAEKVYGKTDIRMFKDLKFEETVKTDKSFAKFLGFYVSEGGIMRAERNRAQISLTQNEGDVFDEMVEAVNYLGFNYGVHDKAKYVSEINGRIIMPKSLTKEIRICNVKLANKLEELCGRGCYNKHLPSDFLKWDRESKLALFDALMKGDGSWNEWHSGVYTSRSKLLADEVQLLALSLGYSATIRIDMDMFYDVPIYRVQIAKKYNGIFLKPENWSREFYEGKVYCVEVEEPHIIFVRRNGKAVWCGNSVEVIDLQGDIVPISEMKKAMYKFMDRGGSIMYGHSNKPVGKVLQWEVEKFPGSDVYGIKFVAKIFKDYQFDDEVWKLIKSGELKGFSIGAQAKEKKMMLKDESSGLPKEVGVLHDLNLMEISVCKEPANPLAIVEEVNYFAKSADEKKKDEKKHKSWEYPKPKMQRNIFEFKGLDELRKTAEKVLDDSVEIMKPFGKWESFDACVSDMKSRGYSEDSAKRICGKLKSELEKQRKPSREADNSESVDVLGRRAKREAGDVQIKERASQKDTGNTVVKRAK